MDFLYSQIYKGGEVLLLVVDDSQKTSEIMVFMIMRRWSGCVGAGGLQ